MLAPAEPKGRRLISRIFLCYRRSETGGDARDLHRALKRAGFDVFMDIDAVELGHNFVQIRDYLKTGMRSASPAEQEVRNGEGVGGARASADNLAGAG